jgi:cytokinin riboside 5'-monophosphate phosphoribohydrolase
VTAICVYCSSSNSAEGSYREAARNLGSAIGGRGQTLVFGGTDIGLMGALGHAARSGGARIIGVLPEAARDYPQLVFDADEVIFTTDVRARKHEMERRADAFIVLPGGFGTMDEFFEILTLKQLKMHSKPIVLLNHREFFAPLLELIEHFFNQSFASSTQHRQLFYVTDDTGKALDYIQSYVPPDFELQWS